MNTLLDIAEFRSSRFSPILPEDSQVNPGVYGAELAYWLCRQLAKSGVVTGYPIAEDWGWFVEYSAGNRAEFAVHCGNVTGSSDHWLLSLRCFGRGLFGRNTPPLSSAQPLIDGIESVLRAEESISDLVWLFNTSKAN